MDTTNNQLDAPRMHPVLLSFRSNELEERFRQHQSTSLLQLDFLSCLVGGFIWALVYFKVSPVVEHPPALRWCWVGVFIYLLPPVLILKGTDFYLSKREYIISIVRVATFLAALELKQRVSWVMPETQGGAGGSLYSEEGGAGGMCPAANSSSGTCSSDGGGVAEDVPVAFHVLMASCVPFLISSSIFLRVRFPFHLIIQTLAVGKLLAGEGRLCAAAVRQCPGADCQESMLVAAQSISQYSGAFPVPHALLGFSPSKACPLLLAFLQLVLGHVIPSFFLYVTERFSREVFLTSEGGVARRYPQDPLDLNLVIFSLALLPPLVSLLWLLLELAESWGLGPGGM